MHGTSRQLGEIEVRNGGSVNPANAHEFLSAPEVGVAGCKIEDYGAYELTLDYDFSDFIVPLARPVAAGRIDRAVAPCGGGVGDSVATNKIRGVRAGLIHDVFSAHQGVQGNDMNVLCLGGKVIGAALALEPIQTFLHAHFSGAARHQRRLAKVQALETGDIPP